MPLLIPALGGASAAAGHRRHPRVSAAHLALPAPRRRNQSRLSSRWSGMERRSKILAIAGLIAGALIYLFTGRLIAVVLVPGRGLVWPACCCSAPPLEVPGSTASRRLRSGPSTLAGVLTVGVGLEEALRSTLARSTPEAIRPRSPPSWPGCGPGSAPRKHRGAFADDLNDATADLVAAYLILGAAGAAEGPACKRGVPDIGC